MFIELQLNNVFQIRFEIHDVPQLHVCQIPRPFGTNPAASNSHLEVFRCLNSLTAGKADGSILWILALAQAEQFALIRQRLRFAVDQIGPVERSACEIAEANHGACGLQRSDGLDRVRPPLIAGVDHDAGGEGTAGRGGDERIEVRLRNLRARCVALALNGAVTAFALLGDEIDTGIGAIETGLQNRPFRPQPDVGETFLVERVLHKLRFHQPFEEAPLVGFGIGDGSYVVQRSLKAVAHSPVPFGRTHMRGAHDPHNVRRGAGPCSPVVAEYGTVCKHCCVEAARNAYMIAAPDCFTISTPPS